MLSTLFTPGGRIAPRDFFMAMLIIGGVMTAFSLARLISSDLGNMLQKFSLLLLIPFFFILIKRSHDAGRSGWWSVLWFAITAVVFMMIAAIVMQIFPTPLTDNLEALKARAMAEGGLLQTAKMISELPPQTLIDVQREGAVPMAVSTVLTMALSGALINGLNRRAGNNGYGVVA